MENHSQHATRTFNAHYAEEKGNCTECGHKGLVEDDGRCGACWMDSFGPTLVTNFPAWVTAAVLASEGQK